MCCRTSPAIPGRRGPGALLSEERRSRARPHTLGLVRPDGAADEAIRAVEAELKLRDRRRSAGDAGAVAGQACGRSERPSGALRSGAGARRQGDREGAIDELLELVRRDRKWNEEAARKHLVTLFEAMGPTDPRTVAARRKLSSILFS